MSGYQFVHYEAYACKPTKKRSLSDIAAEADRLTGHHPHVANPQPPEYLIGDSFTGSADRIILAASESTTLHNGKTRKLRKDANIAIGLVASHPLPINDFNALSPVEREEQREIILDWADSVITFAQSEFGGLVQAACMHWDEAHPHIHILIGNPEPTENFGLLHKGDQARKKAQGRDRSKAGRKTGNDAYKAEMRRFQNRYHLEVGIQYGQTRLGPGKRRLTRAQWKQEQQQAEALVRARDAAQTLHSRAESVLDRAQTDAGVLIETTRSEVKRERELAKEVRQAAARALLQADQEQKRAEKANKESEAARAEQRTLLAEAKTTHTKMTSVLGLFRSSTDLTSQLLEDSQREVDQLNARYEALSNRHSKLQSLNRQSDSVFNRLLSTLHTLLDEATTRSDPRLARKGLSRILDIIGRGANPQQTEAELTRFEQGVLRNSPRLEPADVRRAPQEPGNSL